MGSGFLAKQILSFCWFIAFIHIINSQCTTTDSDTCYINRSTASNSNIQCDGSFKKCIITCSGSDHSCSSGGTTPLLIICPINAIFCIINCESTRSCQGVTILATESKYTEVNIEGIDAGKAMMIHSPGRNGGQLSINNHADFYQSTILSQQNSSNIDINCENATKCNNNTIDGQRVEGNKAMIAVSCKGMNAADCSNTNIYCSNDNIISTTKASCNFHCGSCQNSNMYTMNGILDPINWNCQNNANSCSGSQLFCGSNQNDDFSNLIWDSINSKWIYQPGVGICGFLSTNPSKIPTFNPSLSPTINPSEYPSIRTSSDNYVRSTSVESTQISASEASSTRIISTMTAKSNDILLSLTSLDPLYYIIFVLALSLCCVVCILIFWIYHQQKFTKQLNYSDDIIAKIKDEEFELGSNGSNVIEVPPRLFRVSTYSRKSNGTTPTSPNIDLITNEDEELGEEDSVVLESSPIFNANYDIDVDDIIKNNNNNNNNDIEMVSIPSSKSGNKSSKIRKCKSNSNVSKKRDHNNMTRKLAKHYSVNAISNNRFFNNGSNPSSPKHRQHVVNYTNATGISQISVSVMQQTPSFTGNQEIIKNNPSQSSLISNNTKKLYFGQQPSTTMTLSPPTISALSGLPESRINSLSLNNAHSKISKTSNISDTDSESESGESDESNTDHTDSDSEYESDSNSNSNSNSNSDETETKDGIIESEETQSTDNKKYKFALPAAYENMKTNININNNRWDMFTTNDEAILEYTKMISMDPNHPHHAIAYSPQSVQSQHSLKMQHSYSPHSQSTSLKMPIPMQLNQNQLPSPLSFNNYHTLTLPPQSPYKHKNKNKNKNKNKKNKHKKKKKKDKNKKKNTIKFGKPTLENMQSDSNQSDHKKRTSVATSIISELTQLTELTEMTERTAATGQSINKQQSSSSSREEDETQYTEADGTSSEQSDDLTYDETYDETEYTEATTAYTSNIPRKQSASNGSTQSSSQSDTEQTSFMDDKHDDDDDDDTYNENEMYGEQSKTLNSRITYDGTMKEITIKSDVLDADIMDELYDNKIKPLGLSGKIKALKDAVNDDNDIDQVNEDDDNSSSAPSPRSMSGLKNIKAHKESTSMCSGAVNSVLVGIIGGGGDNNDDEPTLTMSNT